MADSSKVGKTMLVTLSFLLIGVFVMMAFTLYYFKKHKVIFIPTMSLSKYLFIVNISRTPRNCCRRRS